jgi:hypothetical protein
LDKYIYEVNEKISLIERVLFWRRIKVHSRRRFSLGCGNPVDLASLKEGEVVLDLGSGSGFDCF